MNWKEINMVIYLNDYPLEKRLAIIKNFLRCFEKSKKPCKSAKSSIFIESIVKNTDTGNPTLTISAVGRLSLREILEI